MKRTVTIRKQPKRRRRRSQSRLGKNEQVLETSTPPLTLAVRPAVSFWKVRGSRIVGLLVLGLLLWMIYLLFDLDYFYVYRAEVRGNHILSAEEVYGAGRIHSMSVFWIDPAQVAANIERLPNIKEAQVLVRLPAQVLITVEERQPEVIWQTGNEIWWIDNEGLFVPPRPEAAGAENRLTIVDQEAHPIEPDDRIDPSLIRGAQQLNDLKPAVTSLQYSRNLGLVYTSAEGWPVYLGDSTQIEAKVLIADALRADLLARQVTPLFIDVRNPLRATYQEQPTGGL